MSDVAKVMMQAAVGAPDNSSSVTKAVMYVAFSANPITPRRRIVHGRISYNKRMT